MYASWHGEIFAGKHYAVYKQPWIARLVGMHPSGELQREFLYGLHDYSHGQAHHSRGVFVYFVVPPGLYEFFRPLSWKRNERFFGRVYEDGTMEEITREEVAMCLSDTILA